MHFNLVSFLVFIFGLALILMSALLEIKKDTLIFRCTFWARIVLLTIGVLLVCAAI